MSVSLAALSPEHSSEHGLQQGIARISLGRGKQDRSNSALPLTFNSKLKPRITGTQNQAGYRLQHPLDGSGALSVPGTQMTILVGGGFLYQARARKVTASVLTLLVGDFRKNPESRHTLVLWPTHLMAKKSPLAIGLDTQTHDQEGLSKPT